MRFALIVPALLLSTVAAFADPQVSVNVAYGDLNLSSADGAHALAARLTDAAHDICLKTDPDVAASSAAMRSCMDTAITVALVRIQAKLVEKVHVSLASARP